jgi:hypothetical protein
MGDAITKTIERFFDNSLENIGRGNSVSTAPVALLIDQADAAVDLPRTNVGASCYSSIPDVQG